MANPARSISWTARVDWRNGYEPAQVSVDEWMEQLAEYHPAMAWNDHQDASWPMSVTLTLDASSLRQAVQTAVRLIEDTTQAKPTGVEVLTTHEFDQRSAAPWIPPLVGLADVGRMLGVSRQRAAQLAERNDFPPEVARTANGPLFVEQHITAFEARWQRRPGRPTAQ